MIYPRVARRLLGTLGVLAPVVLTLACAQGQLAADISPPNVHLHATPGQSFNRTLTLTNTSGAPITFSVARADFIIDRKGNVQPLQAGSLPTTIASWISIDQQPITLPAQASKKVSYTVTVPKDASSGTHWGTVLFRTDVSPGTSPTTVNGVGVTYAAQFAYIIYVDVGSSSIKGVIADLSYAHAATSSGPGAVSVTYQNTGSALSTISGSVVVRGLDGKAVSTFKVPSAVVLPGELRTFTFSLAGDVKPNAYVATAVISNGSSDVVAGQTQINVTAGP